MCRPNKDQQTSTESLRATSRKTIRKSHVTFFVFQSDRVMGSLLLLSCGKGCYVTTQRTAVKQTTILDTQLGWYLPSLFQCCFVTVFRWTCPSSRPALRGKGKGGQAQHVNVTLSVDQSCNVTDCRLWALVLVRDIE